MKLATAGIVLALAAFACDPPPPIKSSSGELIDGIAFQETFALSSEVAESTLHGDRLRNAVALMDKHGVLAMKGVYKAQGVVDKSTLTIVVRPVVGTERRLELRSCAEANVCAFFEDAAANGVVEHKPLVCRNATPCDKPR